MTRPLSAKHKELTSARVLAEVPYVTITVVEDFSGPTLADPVLVSAYPFDGGSEPGLPFLQRIVFPVETITHLPSPRSVGGVDAANRVIQVTIANRPYRDGFFYDFLVATGRLDRAQIKLSTLVAQTNEFRLSLNHQNYVDVNTSTGGGSIDHFEGRVERVQFVGDEIQFSAKTDLPVVDWKRVPDDSGSIQDRGNRLPYPIGTGAVVRCSLLDVGILASTAQRFAIGDTELDIELLPGVTLPTTGDAMISGERIEWTGLEGNSRITGVLRGQLGTLEADHVIGSLFVEVAPLLLGVSNVPLFSVRDVYVVGSTGIAIRVSRLGYTVNLDNEIDAPGSSGDGITTVGFTELQMSALLASVFADAAVTQQAEYTTGTVATELTEDPFPQANQTTQTGVGALGNWTNVTSGTTTWTANNGGNRDDIASFLDFEGADITANQDSRLTGVRISFDVNVTTLSRDITFGILLFGTQFALDGVQEGELVASATLTATGVQTITGNLLATKSSAVVGMLSDFTVELVKTDLTGNPTIVVELLAINLVYTSVDDSSQYVGEFVALGVGTDGIQYLQVDSNVVDGNVKADMWETLFVASPNKPDFDRDATGSQFQSVMEYDVADIGNSPTVPAGAQTISSATFHLDLSQTAVCGTQGAVIFVIVIDETGNNVFRSGTNPTFTSFIEDGDPAGDIGARLEIRLEGARGAADDIGALRDGLTPDDLIGLRFHGWVQDGNPPQDDDSHDIIFKAYDSKYVLQIRTGLSDRSVDAQIQASAGAAGFEFFALCDGPVAGDDQYSDANSGELVESAADIVNYWLREVGGFDISDLNSNSFDNASTLLTDYRFGFDARNLDSGGGWTSILARLGYETRTNICRPSGDQWQMLNADSSFVFPAPTITLDDLAEVRAIGKDDDEIKTRLTVYSAFDPRSDAQDNRAYGEVQTTDTSEQDVIDREDEFGRQDADPFNLICHTVASTAGVTDWRKYMEQELGREGRIISARVQHWDAYTLEIGDVVNLSHPSLGTGLVKTRVIEVQRDQTRGFQIRFAEVL